MTDAQTLFQSQNGGLIRVTEWSDGWPRYDVQLRHTVLLSTPDRELANALGRVFDSMVDQAHGAETNRLLILERLLTLRGMRYLIGELLQRSAELEQAKGLNAVDEEERTDHLRFAGVLRASATRLGFKER